MWTMGSDWLIERLERWAGLSVAYHAKPRVRERAMVDEGGLDRLLALFEDL